jgi:transcriptional regulator with XRE-family HTH domain
MAEPSQTLGKFLKAAREQSGLTLRAVEQETQVSNAYLSQLESNKIKRPSPTTLYKLATLYDVLYNDLLLLAGYPTSAPTGTTPTSGLAARIGPVTRDEEDALVDYLQFLRDRRKKGRP